MYIVIIVTINHNKSYSQRDNKIKEYISIMILRNKMHFIFTLKHLWRKSRFYIIRDIIPEKWALTPDGVHSQIIVKCCGTIITRIASSIVVNGITFNKIIMEVNRERLLIVKLYINVATLSL